MHFVNSIEKTSQERSDGARTERGPYQVNELVWLYVPVIKPGTSSKFAIMWRGPFKILETPSTVNCVIQQENGNMRVHITRLKPYRTREERPEGFPV